MNMIKVSLLLTAPLLFLLLATDISAAENTTCKEIYGGGPSCIQSENLSIDVSVQDPHFNRYVDNLGSNESKYTPGQLVLFKIAVKNTDAKKGLIKITVTNAFPTYVIYNPGNGKYDEKNRTISWTIDKLSGNEEKVFYAQGMIAKNLPQDTTCVIDQALATTEKLQSQDNTGFCIDRQAVLASQTQKKTNPTTTKKGLPIYPPTQSKKTPDTGPESLALIGLLPAGALGMWLRRKTNKA